MSANPPAPSPQTLDDRITHFERRVAAAAEHEHFARGDLAAELRSITSRAGTPTIVVAGETSRGKSSTVNALLGRPGLLPVDADVTTSVYLTVRAGSPERVRINLHTGKAIDGGLDELARWTTVSGNPHNRDGVGSAELFVESPLLRRGLVLIDTPGVGGIEAGHADMTLAALRSADALLFVLDARAPISAPEAAFLEKASARIETVIFCLTKVDLFPGWETVARQDSEFLAEHLPRFRRPYIVPVSAELAARSLDFAGRGNLAAATRMNAMSNVPTLQRVIEERVVVDGQTLRTANRLRAMLSAIEELEKDERGRIASASGDSRYAGKLEAAKAKMREHQDSQGGWSTDLTDGFFELSSRLRQMINSEMFRIENDLSVLPEAKVLEPFAVELDTRLNAMLSRVQSAMAEGVEDIANRLVEQLRVDGLRLDIGQLGTTLTPPPMPEPVAGTDSRPGAARLLMTVASPMMMGARMLQTGNVVGGVVVGGAGLMFGLWMVITDRNRIASTQDLQQARGQWATRMKTTMGQVRIDLTPEIEQRLRRTQRALETDTKNAIKARTELLNKQLAEAQELANADVPARQRAVRRANSELAGMARWRDDLAKLQREVGVGAALDRFAALVPTAAPAEAPAPATQPAAAAAPAELSESVDVPGPVDEPVPTRESR